MARKSNKTAHVLNLLSGQGTNDEPEKEADTTKESSDSTPAAAVAASTTASATASAAPAQTQPEPVPPNVSIIDHGPEIDPVAEKIREELLKDIEPELTEEKESTAEAAVPVQAEPTAVEPVSVQPAPAVVEPAPAQPEAEKPAQETSTPEEEETIELETPQNSVTPEPEQKPEPDYVTLNIMEEVVKDKIIYFMKQFEVCTCDRCKADTIALTLSGLPAKYRVVDKAAVAPLISFYTSRLISQVTVEALKACTQVKENPRH